MCLCKATEAEINHARLNSSRGVVFNIKIRCFNFHSNTEQIYFFSYLMYLISFISNICVRVFVAALKL